MALATDQVELRRAGRTLLMGPGTEYTVLPGFDPWSRTTRAPQTMSRPYAHGSLVGSEWVDDATVLIPLSINRLGGTKASWMAAHQQLAAAFTAVGDSGEMAELRFEWGGAEYYMLGRPVMPRVNTDNIAVGKAVEQVAFIAADPRIYSSDASVLTTGLPLQQGGLTIPQGGRILPATIPGVLSGGSLDLVNNGTANAGMTVRIDGPAPEPRLILRRPDGSVQSIRFLIDLAEGQWMEIDSTSNLALLNGLASSNQRGNAIWDMDAYPLQPGVNTIRFLSGEYDASSLLTVTHRSAWW
jgi:hypothetical protein